MRIASVKANAIEVACLNGSRRDLAAARPLRGETNMNKLMPLSGGRPMLSKLLVTGSALGLAMAPASPAVAATVFLEFTGTVTDGNDGGGLLGTADPFLMGQNLSFTAHFLFDTALGDRFTDTTSDDVQGGAVWAAWGIDVPSPSLGATLTINGRSIQFSGEYFGQAHLANDYAFVHVDAELPYITMYSRGGSTQYATSLDTPFSIAVASDSENGGYFETGRGTGGHTYGQLSIATITGGPVVSAVPEPVTWAMMLVGFGAIGASMRYGRRKSSVSYA